MASKRSSPWFKKIAGWIKDPLSLFGVKTPPVQRVAKRVRKASKKINAPKRAAKPKKKSAPKKAKLKLVSVKAIQKKAEKIVLKAQKAPKLIRIKPLIKMAPVKAAKTPTLAAPKQIGILVGKITHYFPKAGACAIKVEKTELKEGASIRVHGPTTDFKMVVKSIQINRIPVPSGRPGEDIGIGVTKPVEVGDSIYLVK